MIDGFINDEQITGEFSLSCKRDANDRWMDASGPHWDEDAALKEAADRTGNIHQTTDGLKKSGFFMDGISSGPVQGDVTAVVGCTDH